MGTDAILAVLLLLSPVQTDSDQLAAELRKLAPAKTEGLSVTANDGTMLITLGQVTLTVMNFDVPLPPGVLDRGIEGNLVWPEAKSGVGNHRSHIVVGSLSRGTDKSSRIAIATSISIVAAALAKVSNAVAVHWPSSETLMPRDMFVTETAEMLAGRRPAAYWTRLYFFRGETSIGGQVPVGATTLGLAALVDREIEFEPASLPPAMIAERVLGTVHLLLFGEKEIRDGDTIGINVNEKITVRTMPKGTTTPNPVYQLSATH